MTYLLCATGQFRPCTGAMLNVLINPRRMLAVEIKGSLDLFPRQLFILFRDAINAADIAVRLHDQAHGDAGMAKCMDSRRIRPVFPELLCRPHSCGAAVPYQVPY